MNNLNIKKNIPTVVFLTGTTTGEDHYFPLGEDGEKITLKKTFTKNKERVISIIGCKDKDACYTSFINKISEFLNNKTRVFVPTNMGEKWINCLVEGVGGSPNFSIYSNNKKDSQVCIDINETSKISEDVDLLFVTSLGNVGIDINNRDRKTVMVVYTDNQNKITGQIIEQYANRFRETNVEVYLFFIEPKEILSIEQNFSFDYIEDPTEINLIKNDVATDLYTDQENLDMWEDNLVDRDKVRWQALNEKMQERNTNIIAIGGYLKEMGYEISFLNGEEKNPDIIAEYYELMKLQKVLEYECKVRTLDFILNNIAVLIGNIRHIKRKTGNHYLLDGRTLILENELFFNKIRSLVKKCINISGLISNREWIRTLMLVDEMNFKEIENRIKYMKFVNSDNVDELDNRFIQEVDKRAKLKDGIGIMNLNDYEQLLDDLTPIFINKAYNDVGHEKRKHLKGKLRLKIDVCYIVKKQKTNYKFKQRYTEV